LTPQSTIDLHVHTTASDGRNTPAEVVRLAVELGLSTIALTDHDTTAGLPEAQSTAAEYDLKVLNGIELSSESDVGEVHILGYCIDPDHAGLQSMLRKLRDARVDRARRMVDKLRELGVIITWERVQALAGEGAIGRPHVARALKEAGHVRTLGEAFDRWIANDGPAYVPRFRLTPEAAIALIREAGGVAVLAHPALSGNLSLVPQLVEAGMSGLEVYYPEHSPSDQEKLLGLCEQYGLFPTGGSDFHGLAHDGHAPMASVPVPPEVVEYLPC
jgi:predicted metal-dependent phosphoesterase TrpH